jgi:ATP-dependent Clp protease ATP-binding subunit ClpA
VTDERQLATTPRLQAILARAGEIAREHGARAIGAEHVVLATLDDERAIPTQILAQEVDVARVRSELTALLKSPAYRSTG